MAEREDKKDAKMSELEALYDRLRKVDRERRQIQSEIDALTRQRRAEWVSDESKQT